METEVDRNSAAPPCSPTPAASSVKLKADSVKLEQPPRIKRAREIFKHRTDLSYEESRNRESFWGDLNLELWCPDVGPIAKSRGLGKRVPDHVIDRCGWAGAIQSAVSEAWMWLPASFLGSCSPHRIFLAKIDRYLAMSGVAMSESRKPRRFIKQWPSQQ